MFVRDLIKSLIVEIRRDRLAHERELKADTFNWATLKFRRVPTKTYRHRWVSRFGLLKEIVVFYEDENDKWYVNIESQHIPRINHLALTGPGMRGTRSEALREALALMLNDQVQYFLDEMKYDEIRGPHDDRLYTSDTISEVRPVLETLYNQIEELIIRSSNET